MIVDGILSVFTVFLRFLLSPIEIINISIDLVSSIPVVSQFCGIVAYVLPWQNLFPLFLIVFAITAYKIIISLVKLFLNFIPFLRIKNMWIGVFRMFILIGILFLIVCLLSVYGFYLYKELDREINNLYDLFYDNFNLKVVDIGKKEEKRKVVEL